MGQIIYRKLDKQELYKNNIKKLKVDAIVIDCSEYNLGKINKIIKLMNKFQYNNINQMNTWLLDGFMDNDKSILFLLKNSVSLDIFTSYKLETKMLYNNELMRNYNIKTTPLLNLDDTITYLECITRIIPLYSQLKLSI